ncbi:MAG: hypothetical protein SFU20_03745 [Chitinophagaceae bacterium]|nr:hypothetical protein [Chitinophagaceae bacterium]
MKKVILALATGAVLLVMFSSCTSMRKDCNGVKHYKTKNGIYI